MSKSKRKSTASSRIHCRISPGLKKKVETAAELCGQSITAFTETALTEKTQEVLWREQQIQLSRSAFEAFLDVLHAPPSPPSSKLLAAVEDYKNRE